MPWKRLVSGRIRASSSTCLEASNDTGISSTFVPFESQEGKRLSSYPAFFSVFDDKKDNINIESKYPIIYDRFRQIFRKNSYTNSDKIFKLIFEKYFNNEIIF